MSQVRKHQKDRAFRITAKGIKVWWRQKRSHSNKLILTVFFIIAEESSKENSLNSILLFEQWTFFNLLSAVLQNWVYRGATSASRNPQSFWSSPSWEKKEREDFKQYSFELRKVNEHEGKAITHHSLDCRVGHSFCAMWYKALIAFMLKSGGFLSAEGQDDYQKNLSKEMKSMWILFHLT